jgi:hypothetical protein
MAMQFLVSQDGRESVIDANDIEEAVRTVKKGLKDPISVDCTDRGLRIIYCLQTRDRLREGARVTDPRVVKL